MKKVPASRVRLARVFKRAAALVVSRQHKFCCPAIKCIARKERYAGKALDGFRWIYDKTSECEYSAWWPIYGAENSQFLETRIFALLLAREFVLTDGWPAGSD